MLVVVAASFYGRALQIKPQGIATDRMSEVAFAMANAVMTMEMARKLGLPQPMGEKDTELLTIEFASPAPDVEAEGKFTVQIAFEEFGRTKFEPVIPGLVKLKDAVFDVMDMFHSGF